MKTKDKAHEKAEKPVKPMKKDKKDAQDTSEKAPVDLDQAEKDLRQELSLARLQHASGRLADTQKLSKLRKDIARILTTKNQKKAA